MAGRPTKRAPARRGAKPAGRSGATRTGAQRSPRRRRLRLHFAAAELAPLVLSGGLGEAVAGLAGALAERGHALTCLLPAHRRLLESPQCPPLTDVGAVQLSLPDAVHAGCWREGRLGALRLLLLDLPTLYDAPQLYGTPGADAEARRFAAFARAVAARTARETPDVLVAHDWHAALALCCLRTLHDFGVARGIGCVQVVHNSAYQGRFGASQMPVTGLPSELFHPEALEFWGDLCLLKGGLVWADRIIAVSPTHAAELQTPSFGAGLEGVYRWRAHRLLGIPNGVDVVRHDPATDAALPARFGSEYPKPKATCRTHLLASLGLEPPEPGRLLAAIGRLTEQKGWDVLADAIPALLERGASLALLGDGDPALAERLRVAARRWPTRVAVTIGWDETLAHRLYAGADGVLIPSRFEPCGLVQLVAQRYGALPIAHAVGGLVDTIRDGETGILFEPLTAPMLVAAAERAAALLRGADAGDVVSRLLSLDVSWRTPAASYETVFAAVAREAVRRI
ncbi:glycogen synthase [Myxococcota bacterium]|nr:glycogen synthase [Myxococcota bacterium]MCZ7618158.1 glycogen synthase [Myxococcota bacterium]